MGVMLTRKEVYALINGERTYQDKHWGDTYHSLEEWIVYIEDYLAEARHILTRLAQHEADPQAAAIMRKVAAMAVCAMEQNGSSPRGQLG